ncbi:MAG TPA: hypothetical protein DIS90_06485 [Cytophagales bacterium]|nr:hypothetical protein [Cytophagales bacterium]
MQLYSENAKGGVHLYETGDDYIIVRFHNASYDYKFTYDSAGPVAVEVMKKMAQLRKGLSTYISTQVKEKFASKTPVKGEDKTNFMNIKFE